MTVDSERPPSDERLVVVDAMGGDFGPEPAVQGACEALRASPSLRVELAGDPDILRPLIERVGTVGERLQVLEAKGSIPMEADPRQALEASPFASLPVAARRVRDHSSPCALVSAGLSGAVVLAAAQSFQRLPGVKRAALATVVPTQTPHGARKHPFSLMLDVGATLRVQPRDLAIFAVMGASYASVITQNPRPRVGLLSNGTEPKKGLPEIVEAHPLLAQIPDVEFVGNLEGMHFLRGDADVIVCDGFTGNVTLKTLEGVSEVVSDLARYAYRTRLAWRVALWLLGDGLRHLRATCDWEQYGGGPILGFDRLCIKAHGRSGARALRNSIRVAERCLESGLTARIESGLQTVLQVSEDLALP